MAKHRWVPTDSHGYHMQCDGCDIEIALTPEGATKWDATVHAECPATVVTDREGAAV